MKIARIDDLHGDFGWRTLSFLRIETDDGIVGWSEYYEGAGNRGLTAAIRALGQTLIGQPAGSTERLIARLNGQTIQAIGGINQQAIGALVNALLDIKAKSLGLPVHALFGGPVRDRLPLYWSHCASYRARYPKELGLPAPRTYDDLARIAADVGRQGFKALKTTILMPVEGGFLNYRPTTGESAGFPELNLSREVIDATRRELEALQHGAGPGVRVMLDVNFFFKPEGFLQLARALEPLDLGWLEMDTYDAAALAGIRRSCRVPIASCEHLYGRRGYRPFLDAGSVDVALVDPVWNGFAEAIKIAALVDAYELNVAPHNYYGFLADFIAANFAAAIPNFRIMEADMDAVPWRPEFYTHAPEIVNGEFVVPTRPGWGTDVNEAAVRARPPRQA